MAVGDRAIGVGGDRPAPADSFATADERSGFRVLVVGGGVAVVVESRDLFRAEARGVPPNGVGAVLVPVLGVPDQVSLGDVEALRFALAGLDQRGDCGVDIVVGVLGPSGHVLILLRPFALVDRDRESAESNGVWCLRVREGRRQRMPDADDQRGCRSCDGGMKIDPGRGATQVTANTTLPRRPRSKLRANASRADASGKISTDGRRSWP